MVVRMNKPYWDQIADGFDDAVFDVLGQDRKKVVLKYINEFASKDSIAADYGCGVGRHLGLLAERFAFVHGIDFSGKCSTRQAGSYAGRNLGYGHCFIKAALGSIR